MERKRKLDNEKDEDESLSKSKLALKNHMVSFEALECLRKSHGVIPLGYCTWNYRYHNSLAKGAYKYQPIDNARVDRDINLNANAANAAIQKIKEGRWHDTDYIQLNTWLPAQCTDNSSKFLIVLSVRCPYELTRIETAKQLHWAQEAKNRPTFMLVHKSESWIYETHVGHVLRELGVGLVSWDCGNRVGFGISRLAAQAYAEKYNNERLRVVLCDDNVMSVGLSKTGIRKKQSKNSKIVSGYDTDEHSESDVEGKSGSMLNSGNINKRLYSGGAGAGITAFKFQDLKGVEHGNPCFGGGRPIEQVVVVRPELKFDPCFITSSEDADLTMTFSALRTKEIAEPETKKRKKKAKAKKAPTEPDALIKKIEFTGFKSKRYFNRRDEYLQSPALAHENDFFIEYSVKDETKVVTVGTLAEMIAALYGKNKWDIRSLIIEKILLDHKHGS